jgi:hypothetical protein
MILFASWYKNIKASYVSPLQYQNFNCNQIGLEIGRVSRQVHEVSGQQDSTATKDAVAMGVGLVLFWPALFFLAAGDDRGDELARLKGEYESLESAAIEKECDIAPELEEARRVREEEELAKLEAAKVAGPTYQGAGQSTTRP